MGFVLTWNALTGQVLFTGKIVYGSTPSVLEKHPPVGISGLQPRLCHNYSSLGCNNLITISLSIINVVPGDIVKVQGAGAVVVLGGV